MKIKVFLWLGFQKTFPLGAALKRRKGRGMVDVTCAGWRKQLITSSFAIAWHVLFVFVLRRRWVGIYKIPVGINDFLENWLPLGGTRYKLKLFLFCHSFVGALENQKQNEY